MLNSRQSLTAEPRRHFEESRYCAYGLRCADRQSATCEAPALPGARAFVPKENYSGYATPRGYWYKEHAGIWHRELSAGH
jgi:hypothetical protein